MFCTQCGSRNADDAKFCGQCGKPVSPPAPNATAASALPTPVVRTPRTLGFAAPSYELGPISDLETARSATMMGFLVALLTIGLAIARYRAGAVSIWVVLVTVAVAVGLWWMSRLAALLGLAVGLLTAYAFFRGTPGTPVFGIVFIVFLPIVFWSAVRGTFAFHRLIAGPDRKSAPATR
jgi:hypothetical protein